MKNNVTSKHELEIYKNRRFFQDKSCQFWIILDNADFIKVSGKTRGFQINSEGSVHSL